MKSHPLWTPLIRIGILACMSSGGLSGCASSGLVNVWTDPQFAAPPMKNMLVVAMQPDPARRRLWEDAFADALREHGVAATPSYQLFPNELPDTNAVVSAVSEHNYDGCIATVRLPSVTTSQDVPGYTSDTLITRYNPWTNRYYDYYRQIYTPGYTETQTVTRHKIEVWSTTGQGALVWTATSEVLNPTTGATASHRDHVIDGIIDDLAKARVIPAKK
jgi:hypothetical protein